MTDLPLQLHGRTGQRAQTRIVVLAACALLFLVVFGALWLLKDRRPPAATTASTAIAASAPASSGLSEATLSVLRGLKAPVEIRFYSSLDQGTESTGLTAFAERVRVLLEQYEQAAGTRLRVVLQDPMADADARAASEADGVRPWTLDGDGLCYLGLAVVQGNRVEPLPQLLPEWEGALEPDVTRAIVRVSQAPPHQATTPDPEAAAAALRAVEQKIPNLTSVPLEEGKRILREATVQQLMAAMKETQPQIEALEKHMREVEGRISETERQSLLNQLRALQDAQREQLEEISAELEAQVSALEELKGMPAPPSTATGGQSVRPRTR